MWNGEGVRPVAPSTAERAAEGEALGEVAGTNMEEEGKEDAGRLREEGRTDGREETAKLELGSGMAMAEVRG